MADTWVLMRMWDRRQDRRGDHPSLIRIRLKITPQDTPSLPRRTMKMGMRMRKSTMRSRIRTRTSLVRIRLKMKLQELI